MVTDALSIRLKFNLVALDLGTLPDSRLKWSKNHVFRAFYNKLSDREFPTDPVNGEMDHEKTRLPDAPQDTQA